MNFEKCNILEIVFPKRLQGPKHGHELESRTDAKLPSSTKLQDKGKNLQNKL